MLSWQTLLLPSLRRTLPLILTVCSSLVQAKTMMMMTFWSISNAEVSTAEFSQQSLKFCGALLSKTNSRFVTHIREKTPNRESHCPSFKVSGCPTVIPHYYFSCSTSCYLRVLIPIVIYCEKICLLAEIHLTANSTDSVAKDTLLKIKEFSHCRALNSSNCHTEKKWAHKGLYVRKSNQSIILE